MTMEHIDRSFAVTLAIQHPNLEPAVISEALNLVATTVVRGGEQRKTRRGDMLPGTYPFSFWSHKFQVVGATELVPVLERLISDLARREDFLRQIVSEGGSVELFCGIFADGDWDEILPHTFLRRLAEMHMDLRLDVYPSENDVQGESGDTPNPLNID